MNKEQSFLNELADLMEKHKARLNIEKYRDSVRLCAEIDKGNDTTMYFNNNYSDFVYIKPADIRESANA